MIVQWLIQWTTILFAGAVFFSQTMMDAMATSMILVLLWMAFRWKEQHSRKNLFTSIGFADYLLPAFFVWCIISLGINGFQPAEWFNELLEMKWILFFFGLVTVICYLVPDEKSILPTTIFISIIALYAIVVWGLGFEPITGQNLKEHIGGLKMTGGFYLDPVVHATIMALVLSVFCGMFFAAYKWREKSMWPLLIAIVLCAVSLLLTLQVDLWVTTLAAVVLMAMLMSFRFGLLFLFAKIVGIYLVSLVWGDLGTMLNAFFHEKLVGIVLKFHQQFETVRENLLFGFGLGHSAEYFGQYDQLLLTVGAIGVAIFLLVQIYFLILSLQIWARVSSKNVFQQGLTLGVIGAQICILLSGLFHPLFDHAMTLNLILIIWACVIWLAYEYRVLREKI